MGRSRGGLTTKIHLVVDATGLLIRYDLSPGQAHDSTVARGNVKRFVSGRRGLALPGLSFRG